MSDQVGTVATKVPDELRVLAGRQPHGVMTLAAAAGAGIAAPEMVRWVRAGVLVRLFRGTYVLAEVLDAASPEGRHVLSGVAHVVALEGRSVVSHTTAAAFHGLPPLAPPPERVHLARRQEGQGRSGRGFVVHETYGEGAEHLNPPRHVGREQRQTPRQVGRTAESTGRESRDMGRPAPAPAAGAALTA